MCVYAVKTRRSYSITLYDTDKGSKVSPDQKRFPVAPASLPVGGCSCTAVQSTSCSKCYWYQQSRVHVRSTVTLHKVRR